MNAELKTYIEAICEAQRSSAVERVAGASHKIARRLTNVFVLLAETLDEIGPYCCELRPIRKVKTVFAECCRRQEKDGISYHGLI